MYPSGNSTLHTVSLQLVETGRRGGGEEVQNGGNELVYFDDGAAAALDLLDVRFLVGLCVAPFEGYLCCC